MPPFHLTVICSACPVARLVQLFVLVALESVWLTLPPDGVGVPPVHPERVILAVDYSVVKGPEVLSAGLKLIEPVIVPHVTFPVPVFAALATPEMATVLIGSAMAAPANNNFRLSFTCSS